MKETDVVTQENTAANSTREPTARDYHRQRKKTPYNNFEKAPTPSKPADFSKATVNLQPGSYAYVVGNNLHDGDGSAGPLQTQDGRTSHVVFEGTVLERNRLNIQPAAEGGQARDNVSRRDNGMAIHVSGHA